MKPWACAAAVLMSAGTLWVLSGPERSASVLASAPTAPIRSLEAEVAAHPDDSVKTRSLAQVYLDARQPGLALVLLESAPAPVRREVQTKHVLARALLDQGRADLALDVEGEVVAACRLFADDGVLPRCEPLLLASAVRRTSILREMAALGVKDALAHPEATLVAYRNATREAQIRLQ
jgi:hypothetical protein